MSIKKSISLQNVQIKAVKEIDPATGNVVYKVVSSLPEPVVITEANTIINYELVDTDADILFTGITITPANTQFSKPTISTDGRNLTLSDVNTHFGNFGRQFEFNGQPEVRAMAAKLEEGGKDIENRPPPPPVAP
jgi:hypothetical protein